MLVEKYLPLFVAIPLGGAFLISLLGWKKRGLPEWIGTLIPAGLFIYSLVTLWATTKHGIVVHHLGGWSPPVGILIGADGLTAFMLVIVHFVAACVALYATDYIKKYTSPWIFYVLFLIILAGMNGVLTTCDFFNLFVFMEIASLAACTLVAFGTERHELEAAFKYGVMNTMGALFILLGIALLYGYTSELNMADMANIIAAKGPGSKIVTMAGVFFLVGFGLKAALVPFHAWLPDAHPSAPAPISAILSGLIIKSLGIYALFRIFICVLGMTPLLSSIFLFMGALSMATGAIMAMGQTDFKRLLAYSSLSQVGYIVFGLALGTPLGILGGLFHLFNHSVGKSLLFLTAGSVEYATGTRKLNEMGGLSNKMPVTGTSSLAGAMSIGGIPPFGGFFSKLIIIFAAVQAGHIGYAIWAVGTGVLTLVYLMKAMKQAFRGALAERWQAVREVPMRMRLAMLILAFVCLTGGLLLIPQLKDLFLNQAAKVLIDGRMYSKIWGGF